MLSNYVMPGDRVELMGIKGRKNAEETEQSEKVYRSQVNDILSEESLEITMPIDKGKLQLLPVDGEYKLNIFTNSGIFRCTVRVAERYKSENIYLLALDMISNLSRHQRREYYRYECALELGVRALEPPEVEAAEKRDYSFQEELPFKKGIIVDISGGGMRFVTSMVFEEGVVLYLRFTLQQESESRTYQVTGRLLTTKKMENRPGLFENRVQFLNMDPKDREEVIKFIFEQERKQRKREKGR